MNSDISYLVNECINVYYFMNNYDNLKIDSK